MSEPSPSPEQKIKKAECSSCGGMRNCQILGSYEERGGDEDYQWHKNWFILQCRGCDNVFVQTVSGNSEDYDNFYEDDGSTGIEYRETKNYWPAISTRKKPEWYSDGFIDAEGTDDLDRHLAEVYGALDNDLHMLGAIGIRTSFDVASQLLGVDASKPFKAKLEELVKAGKIGTVDMERLDVLVEAGNASVHRGWRPQPHDLDTMMDILESFVFRGFVEPHRQKLLDAKVAKMKGKVPGRARKAKAAVDLTAELDI